MAGGQRPLAHAYVHAITSFNGKPQATAIRTPLFGPSVACGLPLNDRLASAHFLTRS
jgi:hypothetical protein